MPARSAGNRDRTRASASPLLAAIHGRERRARSREIAAGSELDVYSEASPLGAAILGLEVGTKTSYTAPTGREIPVEIVKVETYTGQ